MVFCNQYAIQRYALWPSRLKTTIGAEFITAEKGKILIFLALLSVMVYKNVSKVYCLSVSIKTLPNSGFKMFKVTVEVVSLYSSWISQCHLSNGTRSACGLWRNCCHFIYCLPSMISDIILILARSSHKAFQCFNDSDQVSLFKKTCNHIKCWLTAILCRGMMFCPTFSRLRLSTLNLALILIFTEIIIYRVRFILLL